jgi:hypothetical protein
MLRITVSKVESNDDLELVHISLHTEKGYAGAAVLPLGPKGAGYLEPEKEYVLLDSSVT